MGFKQAAVLAPISFFLGVLFICFNIDHKLLFTDHTDEAIADGFHFYTTFFNAPPAIKALLHGLVAVGILSLVAKLHTWSESAMLFDGTSLIAYVFGVVMYLSVVIPSLRTIATPLAEETAEVRLEAMTVLSAANVLIILCLCAILMLQAGQAYAHR
ncbi:Shr3 amino acid permease chaperone, partial [Pterulicium gracile]